MMCSNVIKESRQKEIAGINELLYLLWILVNLYGAHVPEEIPNSLILLTCLNVFIFKTHRQYAKPLMKKVQNTEKF